MSSRTTHSGTAPLVSSTGLTGKPCNLLATAVFALALGGCAAHLAYEDGRALLAQGKTDQGLAKFEEAVKREPRNAEYKVAYIQTRERAVSSNLDQADRMASAGKRSAAEKSYRKVLAIDPNSERARDGLRALDTELRHDQLFKEAEAAWEKKDADGAQLKLRALLAENPNHAGALSLTRAISDITAGPPAKATLAAAYRKPITIEFKDVALKQVFEVISRTSGVNFLFDKDVRSDQKTTIFLKNSTIDSAIHLTLLTNQLEQQVVDANTILIYPNTAAKQKDYQEMVVKTFFLTNAEAKTVANTLKTIIKSRDVVIDEKLNMLIVRDSPDAIRLAEKLVALHDVPEPEVMLEVEILEVKRTRLLELGIAWPDGLSLTPLPSAAGGTLTLRDLRTNMNSGTLGATIGPVTINAKKQDADANILANPRIRARNHEKAKILIGDRVPIITTTATATGFVSESISYIDVGLKLDVEPSIYLDNDVAIKVSLEVSNIVSQLQSKSGSVAYQIGTRTASTVLRLKDGENQVLAGLINDEERQSANKVPGLGEIPLIGRLFGSTANDNQKTEIVLSITPRVVRNIQRPQAALSEFRSGTDNNFRLRPDAAGGTPAAVTVPAPAPQPTPEPTPPPVSSTSALAVTSLAAGAQRQSDDQSQSRTADTFMLQLKLEKEMALPASSAAINPVAAMTAAAPVGPAGHSVTAALPQPRLVQVQAQP